MTTIEFTQDELNLISEALASDSYDDDLDNYSTIVRTTETTDDFKKGNRWVDIKRGNFTAGELTGDLIEGYQYVAGDPRVDLMILNFGDYRAVVEL